MIHSTLIENIWLSCTWHLKPIRLYIFVLTYDRSYNMYSAVRHSVDLVYDETLLFNILRWERTRSATFVTRIGARKRISKDLYTFGSHACICLIVCLIYPLLLSRNDSRVRNLRTGDVCTRNLYAWMYLRTRRFS